MRRILVNVFIASITFFIGLGVERAFEKYLDPNVPEVILCPANRTELIDLAVNLPPAEDSEHLKPGSLPAELVRIDQIYLKRCHLPTDWNGEWPTIVQLDKFSVCNDQWAQARRKAIMLEMENYLVQY